MGARKPYRVEWARIARDDLLSIIDYLADDDFAAALNALEEIEAAAGALTTAPKRGRVAPELAQVGVQEYRELVVAPWRLIYRVCKKTGYVLGVLDARRNLEDLLLERFLRPPRLEGEG